MRAYSRLKRFERELDSEGKIWAVFTINYYEDSTQRKAAQQRLVAEYEAKGNPRPTHRVFINELPSPERECSEAFLFSF